ncbi:DUF4097 family beta strand repeat-containing protein [Streptomyces sp. HSW2009]|uniref:DUF4097 family beta strand repeat-containing protein n=1 Tax=Streptomyces sp. HSW2009 TaxID=3142890 RepID=UPI0032F0504B
MSARSAWTLSAPQKLTFDDPVAALQVRIVGGTVNVVGTDAGSASLQVSEIEGPPLFVSLTAGTLSIAYEDLPWQGFLKLLDRKGWQRTAHITLTVPTAVRAEVGTVSAAAVVSGLTGPTEVRGISGDTTLVGLSGEVRADTVSGCVEVQSLGGSLCFNSVSGELTVIDGMGSTVRADSVSGDMVVDIAPSTQPADLQLSTVSGEIAIRLPDPANVRVEAHTTSGLISNAFDDLRVDSGILGGQWGAWVSPGGVGGKISGSLGTAGGRLKAASVSGAIAVLRRPPTDEPPAGPAGPAATSTPGAPGAPSAPHSEGPGVPTVPGPGAPAQTTPSDKKVR